MHDTGLIYTILHLTGFDIVDGLCDVHCNCSALGVGHEALRSQYTSDTADSTHHIRCCHANIEAKPVLGLDLLNEVVIANEISARFLSLSRLIALCEYENANDLTCTVRQNYRTTNLLVSVTGVNTQTDVSFDCLVELSLAGRNDDVQPLSGIIQLGTVDSLEAFNIFLTMLHNFFPPCGNSD